MQNQWAVFRSVPVLNQWVFFFVFACKTGYCGECCLFMCVKCNNINNNYMGKRIDIKQTKRLNVFYVGINCVIKVGRK